MVDSRSRIVELNLQGPFSGMGPEVALVVRRLIASLVLVACLLGIVQPALACANSASRTDCCPAGSPAGAGERMRLASASIEAYRCCAPGVTVTPSVSAVRTRTAQGHASGSPAVVALPTVAPVGQHLPALRAPAARVPDHVDESLTYLRTARLRL